MKTSLLRLLLLVLIAITTTNHAIYPHNKVSLYDAEATRIEIDRSVELYKQKVYEEQLKSYVQDVGTKYKYSYRAKDFLTEDNIDLVIRHCESYPSVVIAMAIIETGWGKYAIGNNYFGIKGQGHIKKTKEWDGSKFITITSSFQYYESMAQSIEAHSNLLHGSRYNIGEAGSYQEAIRLIKLGGYATDPGYERKLNFIIEKYELHRLDEVKDHFDQHLT
jgi:flagellum-specific peptidoglycan hydrolase FlgJ